MPAGGSWDFSQNLHLNLSRAVRDSSWMKKWSSSLRTAPVESERLARPSKEHVQGEARTVSRCEARDVAAGALGAPCS